jgi:hypothetical protein
VIDVVQQHFAAIACLHSFLLLFSCPYFLSLCSLDFGEILVVLFVSDGFFQNLFFFPLCNIFFSVCFYVLVFTRSPFPFMIRSSRCGYKFSIGAAASATSQHCICLTVLTIPSGSFNLLSSKFHANRLSCKQPILQTTHTAKRVRIRTQYPTAT